MLPVEDFKGLGTTTPEGSNRFFPSPISSLFSERVTVASSLLLSSLISGKAVDDADDMIMFYFKNKATAMVVHK